eukprot:tig00020780_g13779.t1
MPASSAATAPVNGGWRLPGQQEDHHGPGHHRWRLPGQHDAPFRTLHINDSLKNDEHRFRDNSVKTSKYTVITFLPKNLFEQFRRAANFYFLANAVLFCIRQISPQNPFFAVAPLAFVLAVSAVKEAFEDWKRHTADKETNNRTADVLREGKFVPVLWKDIRVGDVVRATHDRGAIPADLVLLSTSEPEGVAFIETANLDGETNLKVRQALPQTLSAATAEDLHTLKATMSVEHPNNRLLNFDATIHLASGDFPLSLKQTVFRGCVLRNTGWIHGVVVFTGHDTKVMQNALHTPSKRSRVEKVVNMQLVFIVLCQIIICVACAIANWTWNSSARTRHWYLNLSWTEGDSALSFLTFWLSFTYMVPISLYVTMEIVKLIQTFLINWDVEMYHDETDTPALARTSNLNEELGQVEYVFSDKTGTLTRNQMTFARCSIGGVMYGSAGPASGSGSGSEGGVLTEGDDGAYPKVVAINGSGVGPAASAPTARAGAALVVRGREPSKGSTPSPAANREQRAESRLFRDSRIFQVVRETGAHAESMREFLLCLSLCHACIPERDKGDPSRLVYQGASPDETALVGAAADMGYRFIGRTSSTMTVEILGEDVTFELLNILEFNSNRKRMSVIVRTPEGEIKLYCKGADSVIIDRLRAADPLLETTQRHLDEFALDGLRTLCLSALSLTPAEHADWDATFKKAATAVVNREQKVEDACELIEKDLRLLGATGIEDRLQAGVPETIRLLRDAHIKIWMLTGDKQVRRAAAGGAGRAGLHSGTPGHETAINIGKSCSLIDRSLLVLKLNAASKEEARKQLERALVQTQALPAGSSTAVVIDGATLAHCLEEDLKRPLLSLAQGAAAVICCRVTPLQKALVVRLVRRAVDAITLAIGDGANDVAMIQEAHIGVGISGLEGLQAVRSSDYAIAQFRFLGRLLLVHGLWSYKRISALILYSFYKNFAFILNQLWFNIHGGFSGLNFFPDILLTLYNTIFTALPIIIVACCDQETRHRTPERFPGLYRAGQLGSAFNMRLFWTWILKGVWHSLVMFFFSMRIVVGHGGADRPGGTVLDLSTWSVLTYTWIIVLVTLKCGAMTRTWTWVNHLAVWGSLLFYGVFVAVWFAAFEPVVSLQDTSERMFTAAPFWLGGAVIIATCLLPDMIYAAARRELWPRPLEIIQEVELLERRALRRARRRPNAAAVAPSPTPHPPFPPHSILVCGCCCGRELYDTVPPSDLRGLPKNGQAAPPSEIGGAPLEQGAPAPERAQRAARSPPPDREAERTGLAGVGGYAKAAGAAAGASSGALVVTRNSSSEEVVGSSASDGLARTAGPLPVSGVSTPSPSQSASLSSPLIRGLLPALAATDGPAPGGVGGGPGGGGGALVTAPSGSDSSLVSAVSRGQVSGGKYVAARTDPSRPLPGMAAPPSPSERWVEASSEQPPPLALPVVASESIEATAMQLLGRATPPPSHLPPIGPGRRSGTVSTYASDREADPLLTASPLAAGAPVETEKEPSVPRVPSTGRRSGGTGLSPANRKSSSAKSEARMEHIEALVR